jgi:hypothetical protein
MTADGWRQTIVQVVDASRCGEDRGLDLLAQLLVEQDQAKQALRKVGFGCIGMPWADVVHEILTLTGREDR